MLAREALRDSYGLCGFEWECPDCEKKNKKIEDIYEFADLAFRMLARGDTDRDKIFWLIDETYAAMGYQLPKEIIESFS